ncbi:hypothetical protein [uncultured Campylobacter sp.]|uniref:hypothetical protein n=1 Tax=uncultured Campylobacter sp. TaxID=218934 RepID=UPI00262EF29A|nr:hypothetical protein [uncultured Campylobacter sp.]
MNAARDTPALFYVVKTCIIKDCIGQDCAVRARITKACIGVACACGRNFTASYELQDAAHPCRLDLKFKVEF